MKSCLANHRTEEPAQNTFPKDRHRFSFIQGLNIVVMLPNMTLPRGRHDVKDKLSDILGSLQIIASGVFARANAGSRTDFPPVSRKRSSVILLNCVAPV